MKLWFENFRISILNWFAAGRIVIEKNTKPQEYKPMAISNPAQTTYTLGGSGGGYGGITINPQGSQMNIPINLTIKIATANGGTVVSVNNGEIGKEDLYIIAENADFDRELGKIITMCKLKS